MTPHVGHLKNAAACRTARRAAGVVVMLCAVAVFRGAARILPPDCPLAVWALTASDEFPVGWGDVPVVALLDAPTLAG